MGGFPADHPPHRPRRTTLADVEVSYLHNDAAGSPVAATNAAWAVKWSRGYQQYGEFSSHTGR